MTFLCKGTVLSADVIVFSRADGLQGRTRPSPIRAAMGVPQNGTGMRLRRSRIVAACVPSRVASPLRRGSFRGAPQ
jgi:hypothetical protein